MNPRFRLSPVQRTRYARVILVVMVLAIPLIIWGALMALRSTSNDPRQWLPRSFAATDTYDWFQLHFGSDEIAVVSWPGCTLDDPRVDQLAAALTATPFYDRALSGPDVVHELMQPPLEFSRNAAISRLRGTLVDPDTETTCLVLSTSAEGRSDRVQAVQQINDSAKQECGLDESELRLAGPTVDAAAIDLESRRLLFQLAGLSALVSFLIASIRLRSVRLATMVFVVAVYSTAVALAVMHFTGGTMNLLMTMLPPLLYVLSISSAVHLANYYRDAVADSASSGSMGPLATTVSHGWLPCSLAAFTTAIGLASLLMSKIEPIRMFGLYSAIGVVVSVGVLFLFLPAALHLFPPRPKPDATESVTGQTRAADQRADQAAGLSGTMIRWISRHHLLLTLVCVAVMVFCAWGLPHIKSTVRLQDRFLPSSDAIQDYKWLEENLGPMVPLEVVVHFDRQDPRDTMQRMHVVAEVQNQIHSMDEAVATMSAVNLSPGLTRGRSVRDVVQRTLVNSDRTHQRLVGAHFLADTDDEQLWRITVRAKAIGDLDYGQFAESLRQTIRPLLEQNKVRGTYTGVIPLIYKAQRQLLQDLFRSFLAAFGVIALVLMVVLRSITAALLAMIPNLFPAIVIFGGLEWINIPIQIGSVMTASAALGIAVDDTVHFLTWFRRGISNGLSRREALQDAFGRCSGAMVHTTLICAGGLIVFAASSFVPILHFAWLMVFLLLAALVGDLVLLPAILAGPLGRGFVRKRGRD
ncbi:MMPL family transporter [Stieleria sp. TO1_6]|uniref:efflux RND transporter permease subunit n=1 Tax=Stieleria tagensis TaxID=2956795 RepID=UPI00209A8312|nr:MMPL family transporter [Stieleria tagensis]MCO8122305.1 MMPL family transporter [Stieleria tagensis]